MDKETLTSEFREFIKEHDQAVFEFCHYMIGSSPFLEDQVVAVFRKFGEVYRKWSRLKAPWEPLEVRVELFRIAWNVIQRSERQWLNFSGQFPGSGRDTRKFRDFDDDLLIPWRKGKLESEKIALIFEKRLAQIEVDYRAPLVLRDLLCMEDEQVMRILGLRWGVYRHRLHRGRLELAQLLRGQSFASTGELVFLNPARAST